MEHRQIVWGVDADDPGVIAAPVAERDTQAARVGDDMRVGDDVAVAVKDDSRAQTAVGLDLNDLGLGLLDHDDELPLKRRGRG